jgi:hypothetical protein
MRLLQNNRFWNRLKYKLVFYSGNMESDILSIRTNIHFKEEAVKLNIEYFNRIKEFITSLNFPKKWRNTM